MLLPEDPHTCKNIEILTTSAEGKSRSVGGAEVREDHTSLHLSHLSISLHIGKEKALAISTTAEDVTEGRPLAV